MADAKLAEGDEIAHAAVDPFVDITPPEFLDHRCDSPPLVLQPNKPIAKTHRLADLTDRFQLGFVLSFLALTILFALALWWFLSALEPGATDELSAPTSTPASASASTSSDDGPTLPAIETGQSGPGSTLRSSGSDRSNQGTPQFSPRPQPSNDAPQTGRLIPEQSSTPAAAEPESQTGPEPKAEPQTEPAAQLERELEPKAEPQTEPEAQLEPELEPRAEPEPQRAPESQRAPEPQAEPEPEPEPQTVREPQKAPEPELIEEVIAEVVEESPPADSAIDASDSVPSPSYCEVQLNAEQFTRVEENAFPGVVVYVGDNRADSYNLYDSSDNLLGNSASWGNDEPGDPDELEWWPKGRFDINRVAKISAVENGQISTATACRIRS